MGINILNICYLFLAFFIVVTGTFLLPQIAETNSRFLVFLYALSIPLSVILLIAKAYTE
jgi:hypothetical protein